MDSSLRERFGRLGPIRGIDRVTSGSPAVVLLSLDEGGDLPRTIDATLALARRGLTMLRAKRTIEALLEARHFTVALPTVEDPKLLTDDLARAGIGATLIPPTGPVDVRSLRERLGLTREQFAMRYGLEVATLRNWETGRRELDATAQSYLRAIFNDPTRVEQAYASPPAVQMALPKLLVLALLLATPLTALAGEGNGPNFPGAETPNVGIGTTTFGPNGTITHPGAAGPTSRRHRAHHHRRHHRATPPPDSPS